MIILIIICQRFNGKMQKSAIEHIEISSV